MPARFTLGAVIKARRIELGWTQEDLAERISRDGEYIRQSEVSRLENGKIALPRRERLERIADVLDLTLGELLARSGWAGAEAYFQQSNGATRPPDHQPERGDDSTDVSRHAPELVAAFREALAAMREQSDRPLRDRQVIAAIEQQFLQLLDDDRRLPSEPYSDVADG